MQWNLLGAGCYLLLLFHSIHVFHNLGTNRAKRWAKQPKKEARGFIQILATLSRPI